MKTNRVWIEIVILGTVIACALALLLATLGAAAGAAVGKVGALQRTTTQQTYEGMVTAPALALSIPPPSAKQQQLVPASVCTAERTSPWSMRM